MEMVPLEYNVTVMADRDYTTKVCEPKIKTIKHIKKMPECKNVTKHNCVTKWEVLTTGEKVSNSLKNLLSLNYSKLDLDTKITFYRISVCLIMIPCSCELRETQLFESFHIAINTFLEYSHGQILLYDGIFSTQKH